MKKAFPPVLSLPRIAIDQARILMCFLLFVGVTQIGKGQILWSSSGGSAWLTGSNWTGGAVPTSTQIAQFGVNPTGAGGVGINMNGATNNGANNQAVGAAEVTSARAVAFIIGNSSTTSNGTLTLNGASVNSIGNTILRNNSSQLFTLQNVQGSGNKLMTVALNNNTDNIVNIDGSGNIVISSIISSASGTTPLTLTGLGTGRLDVTGAANTFTGNINLTGPEARFSADGSFGNANNTIIIDGGHLATLNNTNYTLASTHNIQVSNAAGTSISPTGTSVLTYDGIIADKPSTTGILTKQGSGTLALGGVSNYTGSTAIHSGVLQLTTGNDRLPTGTTLNLGQAATANLGTLDLNGRNQTFAAINSISGTNGTASNNTITSMTAATLSINGSGSSIYGDGTNANSGVITGAVSIVKSGNGSLTFGDANTYTGTTTVNQGALIINGLQTGTGAVSVATGATLAGSGTIPGAVSLTGMVSPGNSPGTLNTGAFTFNANSTYKFEISNATGVAGTDWDKIISSGAIDVSASPINIEINSLSIANFNNTLPYTWVMAQGTIINGFNAANFTINATNFLPPLGGGSFSITHTGNDLNIVFSPVAPPVLSTPTTAAITNVDAVLGATITYDGGSAISARGTVYKLSAGVTASDNPLAEGGMSIGTFSHLRNGLDPETQYFYAGYATNSSGTGLSGESNFRTLSNPPTAEATNFLATAFSSSQIDLSWTVATFPGSGASANGYIILRREDTTDPTTAGVVNATAPGSLSLPSGTTLVTTITLGSTNNYSNTSLTSSTQYNYLVVPFTWDGVNASTYNYYLNNAPAANATTLAGLPIVTSPTVSNISSTAADLGANVTSNGGSTLTERGTVYSITTGVTITDNPLAEGSTSIGIYSHTRSGLNPETQYFFKGYAINANGSALGSESSFYTYSAPPTSEVTGFAGAPVSSSEIDLSWTAASFPGMGATATGYVILRRSDSSNPTTSGFSNGNNPASLSFPAGTTLAATITAGATITYNDLGLGTPGGQYNYLIVPFTWDNVNAATYNYYLTNAATTFASTLPAVPTLINPTVTSITENSAILGANITANGGGTLSERGTVYKTSAGVGASDNPLAEGGTAIGIFSHTRNSLAPETQYFYKGYAINAGGTGLSAEGDFRTLSNPPTSETTNFTATTFSNAQIDLSWTAAGYPMSGATATGYIILRKIGTDPLTTGIVNATAPGALTLPAGTVLVTTIPLGATTSYSNTGLAGLTQYNYLIIPFTWNGTNAATYHYYLINGPTTNATTTAAPPILWTMTTGATAWYTNTNWTPSTSAAQWTSSDIAQFQNNGLANNAGINMNTGGSLNIGAIEITAARTTNNLLIGNNSNVNGTLTLNGVVVNSNPNIILRNGSIKNLTLQNSNTGSGLMDIVLGNATNNIIYLDGAGNIIISSVITGTGKLLSLNGVGAGTLSLSGINTFSGGFTLNSSSVTPTVDAAFGTGVLTLNGGTLNTTGTRAFTNNITIDGNFSLSGTGATTLSGSVDLGASTRTITNSTTSGSRIFSNVVSGAMGSGMTFTGAGSGIIYFGATNTFTGDINVNGSEVAFASNAALGNANNTIILDGGRISSATTAGSAVTTSWPVTHAIQVGATIGSGISVQGSTGDLTYDGIISDKPSSIGMFTKQGAGILRLGGVSTYSGMTTINSGILQITTGNNRLPIGTALNLGQAASANLGTLDLNGFNQEVGGLNSILGTNGTTSNNIITSAGAVTLTLSGSGTYDFGNGTNANSGIITGAISLVKNGSGTQTLGDANTYSGTTTINQGVLKINGVQTGNGAVTVTSGGTLGGNGTIPATISLTGIISPGNSAGTINTAAFTFNANSTYKFEISNATGMAGTDWDKINSTGAIDVSASPITVEVTSLSIINFVNSNNYTWVIATGSSITGFNSANFIINTANFLPPLAGGSFSISQTGNTINLEYSSSGYPVLIAPTAASITNVDAVLGANIISQGNSGIITRGTVYKLSPGVSATDNPLAEGGMSTGVYSHLRSPLDPETQYFYAGYATNNSFTGLSVEANFRTLSNPPTAEATGFVATTISAAQIDLNWAVATFPGSGASANGYILLRRQDATNPTTVGIINATAPASLTLPLGTTLVTTVASGSTNSYSNPGLTDNTQYNYLIVPFTWDGVNAATYNYYLPNAPTANATTLPFIPTLNNPTATSITENTAVLGATVVSNSGSTLTERGTVYKNSSPVLATDNPLAEGGIAVGAFSHTRSSLSPETQYFYAGYAINAGGTGMSSEGNFRTLSNSPTTAVTNFLATPFSATQIDLTWTVASFPMSGASANGYIILRKNGVNPNTDGIVDASSPASLTLPGGTTLLTTITAGATNSYSNLGLTAATQYNYLIVPFTWDGVNASTYNYYLVDAPAAFATTHYLKQTFAADGSALNASKWSSPSSTTCDASNQTNAFTAGNEAYFCTPAGTGTGALMTFAGITATESFNLTSASGSISNVNNGVIVVDVATGKTVDFLTQPFSSQITAGYIKNGGGAFAFAGGVYGGGFTLNAGTVIARGVNAMGGNPTPGPLNLNAGTVASSATLNFSNKYSSINFGGDIQFGSTTLPANGATAITFNAPMAMGSPMRTLTLGIQGNVIFGGVISNTSSNGITFTANNSGTGRFDITNTGNTFTGPININGDGGNGVAEVRFTADGSLGNTTNTININGGRLATLNGSTYTLTSTRGIQVGNTAGTSISVTGAGTLTYNGVIADLMGATPGSWAKQGVGTLLLGGVSIYTGSTKITSGELRWNPSANTNLSGSMIMNGGTLSTTGIADTRTLTFASFDLPENSKMDLSTASDHTITFTVAGTFASGKTLTIYGWQGVSGMSGTKGKIFFGNSAAALTADQLAQIQFNDGTIGLPGTNFSATILPTGEVVVGVTGCGGMVLNANDSGLGSLRDVIACVAPWSIITFDASLMGATITLTSGEIEINKNITISGLGSVADLTLSGNSTSRIFHVAAGKTLSLQNLSLKNSNAPAPNGGALYVQGSLTLQNMLIQNNFEDGVTPKGMTVIAPGGLITVIGTNVQIKN